MYDISDEQLSMANDLCVEIFPSKNKRKLIDVYKDDLLFCSVGAINFKYYRELLRDEGAWEANQKKQKILARYKNNCKLEVLYMIRFLWCCE
jgi:hypothetical protein